MSTAGWWDGFQRRRSVRRSPGQKLAEAEGLIGEDRSTRALRILVQLGRHLNWLSEYERRWMTRLLPVCATDADSRAEVAGVLASLLPTRVFGWRYLLQLILAPMVIANLLDRFLGHTPSVVAVMVATVPLLLVILLTHLVRDRQAEDLMDALVRLRAVDSLDAICRQLDFRPRRRAAWECIGEFAAFAEEGDTVLSAKSQVKIARFVQSAADHRQLELLGKVAGAGVLPQLERMAASTLDDQLRDQLDAVLPRVRERAERDRLGASLLQPAGAPQSDPDQLLRPAGAPPEVDEQQLLRPGEGPKE